MDGPGLALEMIPYLAALVFLVAVPAFGLVTLVEWARRAAEASA